MNRKYLHRVLADITFWFIIIHFLIADKTAGTREIIIADQFVYRFPRPAMPKHRMPIDQIRMNSQQL